MLQQAEDENAKAGDVELPALPFETGDVKTLHQTCLEVIKNLKTHMPAPKAKAATKRKETADSETASGQADPKAAPKRRVRAKAS